ncbi:phage tail spike protein [Lactobacillus johnsonii]|uniref:Peptidase S74 domain-containing protein n=1 Tax=Lactobacillus johnsonii (strain FI9785) TaxID=633699 RepID=D0R3Q2_LACJF|nr:phage tail spike protein [Lactobacillus johnsonii]CAX66715.1 hypothetical protein predicted by Glimmer/Critica [Lactobacillus johnsonii FI9785]
MIFYLLNKGQQTVKLLNNDETIESNLDEAINTASELKFSLPLQKRLDSNIYYVLIPEYHGNDFLMFKVISEDVQKDRVEYSAVESAYDELKSYAYIKDIRPHQMNAAQMLQQVLKNTRWSLGYVEDTGIQSTAFYYITILEAIQKIVDLFKVELTFTIQLDPVTQKITGRKVNLYQQQGRRTGKRFEYGSNLLTVTREENNQNLVTALVGRGKGIQVSGQNTEDTTDDGYGRRLTFADVEWKTTAGAPVDKPKGQEYVEDPKATALYGFSDGRPRIGLVTFEDIEDPNELLNATWSALLEAKRPKVSFKAEVTDVGDLQLGDTIAIIRHDLGIEYFTRVYKVHHDLKDKNKNTVEMGDDFSSRSITSAISTAIQTSQDATKIANTAAIAANGKNRNFYSNTKPNWANEGDNLYLDLGNGETELWVWHHGQWEFVQSTVELHTVQKEVQEAQSGLNDAKKQISDNLAKADGDIAELNANIREQKKAFDTDIDELNKSISDQKGSLDGLSTTVNTVVIPKVTDVTNKVSDTITKVNEQKNIVTELQNQATQQGKDISKITTDVHGVTVDLANLNGDVNQTKATVQGLQSTLGNAQGDIAQIKVDAKKLETSLSGKVDNSTYANFVSATNNALNAKLVASDLNGYAKTTDLQATANGLQLNINSVTDKLNNLKIGADNLLNGTGNFKDYLTNVGGQIDEFSKTDYIPPIQNHPEITAYMHSWGDWQSAYSNQRILLEKSKTYWFGFYYCTDNSGSPCKAFNIYSNKNNETSNAKFWGYFDTSDYSFFGNSSRKWLWCTLKIIGDGAVYQNFRVEPSGIAANSAYFAGYTLVQSDVAPTGHVDSFEDTKHELSQLSAQITANNQKFSSYYTKIETDNRANSAKNDAVNAIKNDNNWHGLSNILTNSGFLQNADGFIQKVQQATVPMFSGSGINLVSGTSNIWGDSGWNDFNGTSNQTKAIGKFYLDGLTAGDWVTLHLEYQYQNLSGSNLAIIVQGRGDKTGFSYEPFNLPWQSLQASSDLKWGSFNKTFQITNEALKNYYFTVQFRVDNAKGGCFQWRSFKIEKGKIATPWSASPNDYTNMQSQISQTAGTISTVVGKVNNLEIATNVQVVDHGIDLNAYKSTGTWFVQGTGTNAPASNWFYLDVKKASDGRIVQTWQRDDVPTDRYTRTYIDNHWSSWERSASYSEYSTLSQTVKGLQSTVSNDYTNLQSQISQTAGTIRSEVTNKTTNLQSQITQNANNFNVRLQNATSGGGINLARNTSDVWNDSGWNNFNGASNQTKIITQVYFEGLHVGDWVTGYIEYQYQNLSGNDLYIYIQGFGNKTVWNGSLFGPSAQQLVASNDVKHGEFKFSFQLTEDMVYTWRNNYYNVQLRVDNAKGGWLQWNRIKFEKGTTATTWSPSPNDKVSKNKILAQINVAAGTTLIQNDKIYMDASSTVFSGKAFIPDAAITNISADKINTGTLDAGRINVINLNANNITTGTINGANLKIDLNSGEILFQKGRIGSTNGYLNIDIDSGKMSVTNWRKEGFYFEDGELYLSDSFALTTNWKPKYGVIRRSNNPFTVGESGIEITSPTGVSLQTMNYDGGFAGGGLLDQTKNGASVAVDENGQALINGKQVGITGGTFFDTDQNVLQRRPRIVVGTDAANSGLNPWGSGNPLTHVASRIVIDASYVHLPHSYKTTTGSAPNVFIASDGALVRSTSASKYKTEIKRSYSTEYGEKLLNLPTAIWTDKGQKERYEAGKRHIKPEKYFGMIAEDLADAGLDLLVSRNPLTHEIEGIQYERIAPALLPVIKELKDKVDKLEKKVNE